MISTRNYYIYRHLRADSGTPFYIGLGLKYNENVSCIESEYSRAYITTKSNRSVTWNRVYKKHGRIVEILLDDLTGEEAQEKEREFITLYGRYANGGILCNLTDGGEGVRGLILSKESREKMSRSAKNRKKKRSSESREALSRFLIETRGKPIICTTTGEIFKNRYDVQEKLFPHIKSSHKQVTRACETGKPYKELQFYHLDSNNNPILVVPPKRKIPGEKLTEEIRAEIISLHSQGWTHPQIASKFNVNRITILRFLNGRSWYK